MKDKDFFAEYERRQNETIDDYIERTCHDQHEIRDTIAFLIHHRELMRDVELEALEATTAKLLDKLKGIEHQQLMEELACFKDVLSLHKRLLQDNDKP